MAQKTNLNISPYYDDFDADREFYKVLFNPGKPIQARELTTLQSILQNQIESFGSNIFKEGSMVIPGGITYDSQFYAVKLNTTNYGVDISLYLTELVGKKITGQISGVTASVQYIQLPNGDEVKYPTIYVKYLNSDNNNSISAFKDGESLSATTDIIYGNTTITNGTSFSTLITSNATSIGSAASIADGVYFIRGYFAKVNKETIILDYYTNTPSYRVGLKIDEQIVTSKDEKSLYDNAKGFTNYAAPGADRFKISVSLTKKLLTDNTNDTDFIELLRVGDGKINKITTKTDYNIIRDYLAERTYDESGNYVVNPFTISLNNSLNDGLGNNGLFFSNEKTSEGNTPSDNLMSVKFSPGKAYVRGYDIEKTGTTIVDVKKPRDTQTVTNANIPFLMGNLIRVNNISGAPQIKGSIDLYDRRKNSTSTPNGIKIGDARVYTFNLTDSAYSSSATNWDLYLFDVQTYTQLTLNQSASTAELPATSFIKGKSSGASGYAVSAGGGSSIISLRQTSGSFIVGEQLLINGLDTNSRTIASIKVFNTKDIKSVYQASNGALGFPSAFLADTQLDKAIAGGLSATDSLTINTDGTATAGGKYFSGITTNSIIRYQRPGFSTETYNRVVAISPTLTTMTLIGISSVTGICDGGLPTSQVQGVPFTIGIPKIRNDINGSLYTPLPNSNISSINLNTSNLIVSQQITAEATDATGAMTFNTSQITGITSAFFEPFNPQRYSVYYSNAGIATITSDQFSLSGNTVTISGLSANQSNIVVNTTLIKNGIQSKIKTYNRSKTINIALSKYPQSGTGINTSINDGLTYNQFYGLRVQDEEICLNYPDVSKIIAIYESLDTNAPTLDTITFSSTANVKTNAIIGENIIGNTGKAIARVVATATPADTLQIAYLNSNKFSQFESVTFAESNITTQIQSIVFGKYKNVTKNFTLDRGQKEQYYDYSKIVRNRAGQEPVKQLLVVFDYYSVPSTDNGDVFTVLSYDKQRYQYDIPLLGKDQIRATDTLDFRPRVSVFSSTTASPFDFSSRTAGFGSDPKLILSPNESSLIGYEYYLGRIDRVYLDRFGNLTVERGVSSTNPKEPTKLSDVMDIATITLPPYLYYPEQAQISLFDNRRYTMRDIGSIDSRVDNLEKITSLSLLEVSTQTLQVQDAQGFNRFKTGFFVDDFKNTSLIDLNFSSIQVDSVANELIPIISKNSLKSQIAPAQSSTDETLDLRTNFALLDSNVQKNKNQITLKYTEVGWIEQPLATQVENVNPFHVINYSGTVQLSPSSDNWIRTIRLPDKIINTYDRVRLRDGNGHYEVVDTNTYTSSKDILISSGAESYMRSRNTEFSAINLKPLTSFYQFFDGNSAVDFIPKLVEIATDSTLQTYGASTAFQVGETVLGYITSNSGLSAPSIQFRVATSNHKYGPFNNPTKTYNINPYIRTENISASYSSSSKVLNIDTFALSEESQGKYSGYLTKGMRLVGQTSGAVAYVKDLRLISDNYGDLIGSFFLKDPNADPAPTVRIATGTKTYRLSSSSTNTLPLPGSNLISSAENTYKSTGVVEVKELNITKQTIEYFVDPLAQSFTVGGNIGEAPNANGSSEDSNGCFLTAVDLFFASKDSGNAPVQVEIRTMDGSAPSRTVIGAPKTLKPEDINLAKDIVYVQDPAYPKDKTKKIISSATPVATKVTFDYPIYLEGGAQYAIVIISAQSNEYELFLAEMGKASLNTKTLPNAEQVRYTQQFAVGRLYKSQNGSEWTPNDYQDLKFKLYKAEFSTTNPGTATFYNPTLDKSNGYVVNLNDNPVTTFARNYTLGITTTTNSSMIGILTTGRKISEGTKTYNYGYIVGTGSSVASVGITTGGAGYTVQSNVSTYAITGSGSGLTLNITGISSGSITNITSVSAGNGYSAGDVVGIVTSSAGNTGRDARITVSAITGVDTLYLSGVQGQSFTKGATLAYYDNSGNRQSLTTSITNISAPTNQYSGNYARIEHFNHGMYALNNKLSISNVQSSTAPVSLFSPIISSSTSIAIGDTSSFGTFEGAAVSATNPGYVLIENEIIQYTSVGSGTLGASPGTLTRGQDSTVAIDHPIGSQVYKYESSGVSLRRINTTHDISDFNITSNGYYVEFDRSSSRGTDRSSDNSLSGYPQLSFANNATIGGSNVLATENIQYDAIIPTYNIITPGSFTSANAFIRTISGTSINGTEVSFQDLGYEPIQLNKLNKLSSTRIVCSKVNETIYLGNMPRNKSFTTGITLATTNKNLSPIIYSDTAFTEFHSNLLNQPITDYTNDNRVNSYLNDPNAAVYVSNEVRLTQQASSLKVIFSAYRHSSADIRVLYSLIRPDSSEISQSFELFPGYDNLTIDSNQDGYPDIIDPFKNSGRPDIFVPASNENKFLEYQFTHYPAYSLDLFSGYRIKIIMSGTDQAHAPRIKELRTIAIR
jgi:hypothetical protein